MKDDDLERLHDEHEAMYDAAIDRNYEAWAAKEQGDDRSNDADWSECNLELERLTLDALDRCADAGGRFDDLYFLAAQLGVGERFRKTHVNRPAR